MERPDVKSGLMTRNGILMFRGSTDDAKIDWNRLIKEEREERIRHIAETSGFTGPWIQDPEESR